MVGLKHRKLQLRNMLRYRCIGALPPVTAIPHLDRKAVLPLERHSLPLSHCHHSATPYQICSVERPRHYGGIIMDLWTLSSRSLLLIRRSAWHTSYLFAYCQSIPMSREPPMWAGCPIRFGHVVRFLSRLPLDQARSPIYHTLAYLIFV